MAGFHHLQKDLVKGLWASVVAMAGMSIGCQSTEKTTQQKFSDRFAETHPKPSMWDRMTGRDNPTTTTTAIRNPQSDFSAMKPSKPGTPIKVETEVELADTMFASAIDPTATGTDRDRRLDQARLQFTHVLERDPRNGKALLGLARIYGELGDKDRASKYLAQYFEVNPRDHKTAYDLAMQYGKKHDFSAASAGCEYALSMDPENREYRKAFGFFTALSGNVDQSLGILTQNRTMSEAEARFNIAGLLEQTNQVDAARQQLRLSLQADPLFEPAKALLNDIDQNSQNPVVPAGFQQGR
jgi:Tfp pilus assembly protein PilF